MTNGAKKLVFGSLFSILFGFALGIAFGIPLQELAFLVGFALVASVVGIIAARVGRKK